MRKDGWQLWRVLAVTALAGSLVAVSGCSKLKTSLDKRDTVSLADLQAKVANLEQQVADLQTSMAQLTEAQPDTRATQGASQGGAVAQGTRAVVTASYLNVRSEPNSSAEKVAVLKEGSVVQVMAEEGNWAKVTLQANGQKINGWVSKDFIRKEE